MGNVTARRGGRETSGREAWELLARLVYPPPFIAIARELELSPASFGALRVLEEPRTMSEMARLLRCDNSNVTGLVDSLEERGLAVRRPSERDRRVKLVEPTAAGRRLRSRLNRSMAKPPAWVESLSEEDRRSLRDILRRASGLA